MKSRIIQTAAALMFACMAALAVGARIGSDVQGRFREQLVFGTRVETGRLRRDKRVSRHDVQPERLTRGEFLKLVDRCVGGGAATGQQLGERIS